MGVSRDRECCEMIMIRSSSPACIGPVEVIARESGGNRMVVQLGNGPGRSPASRADHAVKEARQNWIVCASPSIHIGLQPLPLRPDLPLNPPMSCPRTSQVSATPCPLAPRPSA